MLNGVIPQVASEVFRQIARQQGDVEALLGGLAHQSQFEVRAT